MKTDGSKTNLDWSDACFKGMDFFLNEDISPKPY
jgi:hypothetical protein